MNRFPTLLPWQVLLFAILTGIVPAFVGCSSKDDGPSTYPVTGIVLYEGQPLAGATLTFHRQGQGVSAQAITDQAGEFEVTSYFDMGQTQKQGMVPGDYQVTATKLDVDSIQSTMQPPKELLPRKYTHPNSSGLAVMVGADSENHFELKLK